MDRAVKGKYAVDTKVPASQSRAEIEHLLKRYEADSFAVAIEPSRVTIGFRLSQRMVRFTVATPNEKTESRAYRQVWRALLLCIKGKLESVATGIEHFDEAFMANIVMPDGQTIAQRMLTQVSDMYKTGKMPPLLGYEGK
jgi:hypothetical protein